MHVALMPTSNDDNAATRQWAPCSLLDDIANSNGTLLHPMIYLTRAEREGEGGRGLRMSNLSASGGVDGDTVYFYDTIYNG